ncbi:MAG: hypothetical protein J5952_09870 [Prevotella sp.]|nr:hypothetical protein [Prevotella sp.]
MFEGLIAAKFANKMFEKDVFKTIRIHSPECGEMIPSESEFCPECDAYIELNKKA